MEQQRRRILGRLSPAVLCQIVAVVGIWASIGVNSYFRPIIPLLLLYTVPIFLLSHFAYKFGIRSRVTPLVASHFLCLTGFSLYGIIGYGAIPIEALQMVVLGPFAWGFSAWSSLTNPYFLIVFISSIVGLCLRPSPLTSHLFAATSVFWYVCGYVLYAFAALGT